MVKGHSERRNRVREGAAGFVGAQVSSEMKSELEAAAEVNGRSISEEVRTRLAKTFRLEGSENALDFAYGYPRSAALTLVGHMLVSASAAGLAEQGFSGATVALAQPPEVADGPREGAAWLQVCDAVYALLLILGPRAEDAKFPQTLNNEIREVLRSTLSAVAASAAGEGGKIGYLASLGHVVSERLGPWMLARINLFLQETSSPPTPETSKG
jgi:hypothetical protein